METDCNAKWAEVSMSAPVHTCGLDKGHEGPCSCWLCGAQAKDWSLGRLRPVTDRIEREKA